MLHDYGSHPVNVLESILWLNNISIVITVDQVFYLTNQGSLGPSTIQTMFTGDFAVEFYFHLSVGEVAY